MAELLNTKINGTLNVNDYFNIDENGNLTLNSGNNEIFKVGNNVGLALKKNGFNLFSIDSSGLNLYIPSTTNENILNVGENGLTLNKGNLIITNGEIKAKTLKLFDNCNIDTTNGDVNIIKPVNITETLVVSKLITANDGLAITSGNFTSDVKLTVNENITGKSLNINGSANIDLQTTDDLFSITYNKSSLLKQETDNLYISNGNITNIDTGFLNIDVDKNLEMINIYGGKDNEIGIPSSYDIKADDYIIVNAHRYKVVKVYTNPEIKLYGFLFRNISNEYYAKFPTYYYGNIKTNYKILDNADYIVVGSYRQISPQIKFDNSYIYGVIGTNNNDYYTTSANRIVYSSITSSEYNTLVSAIKNACNFTADEQTPIKKYIKSGYIIGEDKDEYNTGYPLIILTVTTSDLKLLQLDSTIGTIKSNTVIYKEVSKTSDSLGLVTVNGKVNAKELYENGNRVCTHLYETMIKLEITATNSKIPMSLVNSDKDSNGLVILTDAYIMAKRILNQKMTIQKNDLSTRRYLFYDWRYCD